MNICGLGLSHLNQLHCYMEYEISESSLMNNYSVKHNHITLLNIVIRYMCNLSSASIASCLCRLPTWRPCFDSYWENEPDLNSFSPTSAVEINRRVSRPHTLNRLQKLHNRHQSDPAQSQSDRQMDTQVKHIQGSPPTREDVRSQIDTNSASIPSQVQGCSEGPHERV